LEEHNIAGKLLVQLFFFQPRSTNKILTIEGMSKMQNHINESVGHQKPNGSLQRNPSEDAHLEESKSLYSLIFFISM
jgi:hypothetical protein